MVGGRIYAVQGGYQMTGLKSLGQWCRRLMGLHVVDLALAVCGGHGNGGSDAVQDPPTNPPGTSSTATALNISVASIRIGSLPVVRFTVTSGEYGFGFSGFTDSDPRFSIAKLITGTLGTRDTSMVVTRYVCSAT